MPYLMELTDFRPDIEIQKALASAIAQAQRQFNQPFEGPYPRQGIGFANLRARDVAFSNQSSGLQGGVQGSHVWGVSAATADTLKAWINLNIDDRLFVVWTGLFNRTGTPHITHIKPTANGQELPLMSIEEIYTWERTLAYLTKPMIIIPKNQFRLDILTDATISGAPAERIGALGYAVASRSYLIRTS